MRRWTLWIAIGLAGYLAFGLFSFPARIGVAWFAPPTLTLSGVAGTIWNGQASRGAVAGLPLADLRWNLKPMSLLRGRFNAHVSTRLADGFIQGGLSATLGRLVLSDLQGTTRLSSFEDHLPLGGVDAIVTWQLDRLEFVEQWPVRAIGQLRVASLSAVPFGIDRLGDYQVDFTDGAGDGDIDGLINDRGGPLAVMGNLTLAGDRTYSIAGRVTARPDASVMLTNGLALLGTAAADGSYQFQFSGTL